MTRGTTPTHYFYFGYALPELSALYVTYAQNRHTIVEKALDDVTIAEDRMSVSVKLTQQETLLFTANVPTEVQLRFEDTQGNAYATKANQLSVSGTLKGGEI